MGLNTMVYEPVTSSENTLGYPAGTSLASTTLPTLQYRNVDVFAGTAVGTAAAAAANILTLKRQGPYGWSSWKQLRGSLHPVTRTHRTENRISWLGTKALLTNPITGELLGQSFAIKTQI